MDSRGTILGAFSLAFVSAMIASLGTEWLEFTGLALIFGLILALLFEADGRNRDDER